MKYSENKNVTILIIFNEENDTFSKWKNEIQRMNLIKLIRARPEYTMFSERILDMEFVYNDNFILHLFFNTKTINLPNIMPQC